MRSFAQPHKVAAAAIVAGIALVLGALAACADPASTTTAPTEAPSASASADAGPTSGAPTSSAPPFAPSDRPGPSIKTITVMRSGGFAGLQQTLTITGDGSWTFVDKRANLPTTTGRLSQGQLEQLTTWVGDPAFAAEARLPGATGTCYDGITYTITVDEFAAKYERCGNAAARPLTDKILALLVDATAL
jgi:hypothetical protein